MFRKHHKRWAWVWVVALLCFAQISQAQVYTWTDENGKRHFGDEVSTPENRRESPVKVLPRTLQNVSPHTRSPTVRHKQPGKWVPTRHKASQPKGKSLQVA